MLLFQWYKNSESGTGKSASLMFVIKNRAAKAMVAMEQKKRWITKNQIEIHEAHMKATNGSLHDSKVEKEDAATGAPWQERKTWSTTPRFLCSRTCDDWSLVLLRLTPVISPGRTQHNIFPLKTFFGTEKSCVHTAKEVLLFSERNHAAAPCDSGTRRR